MDSGARLVFGIPPHRLLFDSSVRDVVNEIILELGLLNLESSGRMLVDVAKTVKDCEIYVVS